MNFSLLYNLLQRIFLVFLIGFSISCFGQTQKCKEGSFYFYKNNEGFSYQASLVKNGMIISSASLQKLFCADIISKKIAIKAIENNNLEVRLINDNKIVILSFDIIDTKASLSLCVDEFIEKLSILFKEELTEIKMNTPKGIPFLTFTKIK
ncbi:MAG: hypothetical protein ACPGVH_09645 [Chitinophagales bacterium]